MSEWLNFSLSDALMFSPRVYYRLIVLYNEVVAPAQLLALALGVAILVALIRGKGIRFAAISLGIVWIWVSYAFLWERFATINWPIDYIAPFMALQGAALIAVGVTGGGLSLAPRQSGVAISGQVLFSASVLAYPYIAPLLGRSWSAAEIFGLMPDPTVIATLAFLSITSGGIRWALMIVPVLWCVISALMLGELDSPDYVIPLGGAIAAIGIGLTRSWTTSESGGACQQPA
ncbi:MAG: hypothetical protein KTR19_04795 [Hyphomicrobiales bacterium]|nr:hypothetical protein [Hyphomicrobiales bacterium]